MRTETVELIIPNYALCYIEYGDKDDLEESEVLEIDTFLKKLYAEYGSKAIHSISELGFCRKNSINNMGANCTLYHLIYVTN